MTTCIENMSIWANWWKNRIIDAIDSSDAIDSIDWIDPIDPIDTIGSD